MPVLEMVNDRNESVGQVALDDAIFDGRVREHLIHEVVVSQLASRRAGTASAKSRSYVQGSGTKPWRQKGTGRARAGHKRSPLWRHGGVIFPPIPRSYAYRPPKKVRRGALISALNRKIAEGNVKVLDAFRFPEAKSREVVGLFGRLGLQGKILCVTAAPDPDLRRASWNVPGAKNLPALGLNVLDVENADVLLCSREGIEAVQDRLRRACGGAAAGRTAPEGGLEEGP
ncbi:MAG: 50S ribosomal protein L4 [Candidatus Tectomicrobia bacterium]|nr:50S ribosomal protein L4 [Candidatus Tectomicrobia bacterium]